MFRSDCKTEIYWNPHSRDMRLHAHNIQCSVGHETVKNKGQTHIGFVCNAIQRPCRAAQQPATWEEQRGYKEDCREVTVTKKVAARTRHERRSREQRQKLKRRGCRWAECFLLFTNVFISSLFTLLWLTVVCCSSAISSAISSSASSPTACGSSSVAGGALL